MRFLFEPLLLANYCLAKCLAGSKDRIIPGTLHFFATPIVLLVAGLYTVLIAYIPYKFTFILIFIGLLLVMLPLQSYLEKEAKKDLHKWKIVKQYKVLPKKQRINKSILAGFVFLGGALFSIYLCINFLGGYSVNQ